MGRAGDDTLSGAAGRDWLDGGTGADAMFGGLDGDTYVVDNVGDSVVEYANQGIDVVQSYLTSYTLPGYSTVAISDRLVRVRSVFESLGLSDTVARSCTL